jgi:hypothetical protein
MIARSSVRQQIRPGVHKVVQSGGNHVQKARSYLFSRHPNGFGIPPAKFAAASAETGASFDDLIKFIARMYAGGSQQSLFRGQDLSAAAGNQGATQ